jgi:DNA-binding transcriptional ArsR family regulator
VATVLGLAPATASHHLTALRDAGLLAGERVGRPAALRPHELGDRLGTA